MLSQKVPWWITLCVFLFFGGNIFFFIYEGHKDGKFNYTRYTLRDFERCIEDYANEKETIPNLTLQETMILLVREARTDDKVKKIVDSIDPYSFTQLMKNEDLWGRPFVYELKDDGFLITLRSLGADGRDDGDKGDDLQKVVDLRWLKELVTKSVEKPQTTQETAR